MAHMLGVTALEESDPVPLLILPVVCDPPLNQRPLVSPG